MQAVQQLMLEVWREACRHIEIHESAAAIAERVVRRLPMERLVVRRVHADANTVETVATALGDRSAGEADRSAVSPDAMRKLMSWCRRGEVARHEAGGRRSSLMDAAAPGVDGEPLLIGPLMSEHGTTGILTVVGRRSHRFTAEHEQLVQGLLEPFSAALENDARLQELTSLRQAAEADKQSLLIRLGRDQLGETIVGAEAGLRPVMERVRLVARSDAPVLILGETGSGKEVVARAIHNRSPRASGPFIRVNCGAIPPELVDSELFGHEKGSFSGAIAQRRGWFERADDGTLFLDEIGELPPAAQVRLLRVLQDGVVDRVGGEQSVKVDVRIVAATHRDLAAMVREGTFREDLWYRVAIFPILLPPLRERTDDIAALASHFARRAATRFGLPAVEPTEQDLVLLRGYSWPGNVRELGAVIDRAAILGNGERLEVAAALGVASPVMHAPSHSAPAPKAPATGGDGAATLNDAMRQHIEATLERCHGRIEGPFGAAKALNINPYTLRSRMRKLGIDWSRYRSGATVD